MSRIAMLLLPLTLTSGCLSSSVNGVWLFDVPYPKEAVDPCTEVSTENFLEASFPEEVIDDSEWTFEVTGSGSDTLYFGQIVTTTGGAALLVIGEDTYPGTKEDGEWLFTWSDSSSTVSSAVHDDFYSFVEEAESLTEIKFRFTPDGATASGKIEATTEDHERSAETDEWSADAVGLPSGSIRTGSLEPDGGQGGVRNDSDVDECAGDDCELTFTTTCSSVSPFTATRTDHDPDAYEYLVDAGQ
jgi:hypothetical protein